MTPQSALLPLNCGGTRGPLATESAESQLRAMKIRDLIRLLEDDGWVLVRTRGSHRQYKHEEKQGLVTVPGHPGDDVAPGTLNSILKQAGLK